MLRSDGDGIRYPSLVLLVLSGEVLFSGVGRGGGGRHEAQAPSHLVKNYRET